jgi:hypothetical protein
LADIEVASPFSAMAETLANRVMSAEKSTAKNTVVREDLHEEERFLQFIITSPF